MNDKNNDMNDKNNDMNDKNDNINDKNDNINDKNNDMDDKNNDKNNNINDKEDLLYYLLNKSVNDLINENNNNNNNKNSSTQTNKYINNNIYSDIYYTPRRRLIENKKIENKNNNDEKKNEKDNKKNNDNKYSLTKLNIKNEPKLRYFDFFDDQMRNFINNKFPPIDKKHFSSDIFNDEIKDTDSDSEKEIPEEEKIFMKIDEDINDISDLIKVGEKYSEYIKTHKFGFDMKILIDLIEPLKKIELVIGMSEIKVQLVDQILSSLQNLYNKEQRFHTVIKGPPGVGKTMLSKILCDVYGCMGILKNKNKKIKFKVAKRSDLIGKYLGHTAKLTQEVIDKCDGGVLFIDEVYSLGNPQKKDSFAKECIDTLNLNLTEKDNFVCIIAGYPEEIETCFFAYNPGLRRRFSFTYSITKYTVEELTKIFIVKISISEWLLSKNLKKKDNLFLIDFFNKNIDYFPHFGGDIDTLILKCRTAHGRRIFGGKKELRKILTKEDIYNGFETYKLSRSGTIEENNHWEHMYV